MQISRWEKVKVKALKELDELRGYCGELHGDTGFYHSYIDKEDSAFSLSDRGLNRV